MSNEHEKHDNEKYSKNFTRIPNILFASYKKLTKEEKFLYCTLREVYWDMKPRFVSLRDLSELTDYSIGALSKMLPRLNTCGLIHAEKKKEKSQNGKEKGNLKYHITIPDIWELNKQFFDCSPNEQVEDPSDKLDKPCSPNEQVRSLNEQPCSPNDTNLFTKSDKVVSFGEHDQAQVERAKDNKDITKDRKKESTPSTNLQQDDSFLPSSTPSLSANENTPSESSPQVEHVSDKQASDDTRLHIAAVTTGNTSSEANAVPSVRVERKTEPLMNEEQKRIAGYLKELDFEFDLTDFNRQHLTKLAQKVHNLEQMKSLMDFTENQEHLKGKQVFLGNLANTNNLTGWKQEERRKQTPPPSQKPDPSKPFSVSGLQNHTYNPPPQPKEPPPGEKVKLPDFKLRRMNKPSNVVQ